MVNFAGSALVALLAATASAEHHHYGRRHIHARNYPVAPPAGQYSAAPVPSESSSVATVPEASASSVYSAAPHNYPHHVHHPHPSAASSVPSAGESSSSAPYGYGNSTVPAGPTGSGAVSTPEVPVSTATVSPLPETTPVASNGGEGGNGGNGGNGYPTAGAPGGTPSSTPGAGEGSGEDSGDCGPVVVTVTVTAGTTTVTSGESETPSPASEASTPVAASSHYEASTPVESPSTPASTPVESPSAPASTPVASVPVASESSSPAAPVSYPASTPEAETPATTPVASETESQVVHTPAPSSEAVSTPVASYSSAAESSSAVSTPSSTPSSGSKRGIVYQEQSDLSNVGDKCGWGWNWNSNNFGQTGDWTYVPIVNNMEQAAGFASSATKAISSAPEGSKYAMGFNEPDMNPAYGGSGMSASDAASNYIKYVNPIEGAKLGSISVTSTENDANAGLPYLESWKKACDAQGGCTVDFVNLHWYGNPSQTGEEQAEGFISYMKGAIDKVHELWGEDMKIWVTEFACKPDLNVDATNHPSFIKSTLKYLEGEPNIEKYAYFMAAPEFLINGDGSLTEAGDAYFNYQ